MDTEVKEVKRGRPPKEEPKKESLVFRYIGDSKEVEFCDIRFVRGEPVTITPDLFDDSATMKHCLQKLHQGAKDGRYWDKCEGEVQPLPTPEKEKSTMEKLTEKFESLYGELPDKRLGQRKLRNKIDEHYNRQRKLA